MTNERNDLALARSEPSDLGMQAVVQVSDAVARMQELQSFIRAAMKEGEDYGIIPGTGTKPTLFKPGAEKLCEMYGLSITLPPDRIRRFEDWEAGVFAYEVVCSLVSRRSGLVVAEGIGCCSSKEGKYAKRDGFSQQNTILKMAKKRAVVDAALSATRSSGIFTQDLEDIALADSEAAGSPAPRSAPSRPAGSAQPADLATTAQVRAIYGIAAGERQLSQAETDELVISRFGVKPSELTRRQASELITALKEQTHG